MSFRFRDLNVTLNVQIPTKVEEKASDVKGNMNRLSFPSLMSDILDSGAKTGMFKGFYPKGMAPDGVYIATSDGFCVKPEFWGLHSEWASKVIGCAIIEGDKKILIAPDESKDDLEYASEYEEIPGLKAMSGDEAKNDWDGRKNTAKLVAYGKSEAAEYCNKYSILNRVAGSWHLPGLAETILAQKYTDRVNACLTISGKSPIKFTNWYWTSTQYSGGSAWLLYWSDGNVNYYAKDNSRRVRAFAAL